MCEDTPVASHRKACWIWSAESGTGKSSIVDLLRESGKSVFMWPRDSTIKDAVHMYDDQEVVVFDVPRDGRVEAIYEAIETVTDQCLVSGGKYSGSIKRFLAHTIVLSNMAPDHDRLPGRIQEVHAKPLADEDYEMVDLASQLDFN